MDYTKLCHDPKINSADFIELLTHVCRLVRAKWSKARLLHTCFAQQPWLACRSLLEGFTAQVYQGRWNSATDAVKQVSRVLQVLKGAWNLQKFGQTSNAHGLGLSQSCSWQRYLCYVPTNLPPHILTCHCANESMVQCLEFQIGPSAFRVLIVMCGSGKVWQEGVVFRLAGQGVGAVIYVTGSPIQRLKHSSCKWESLSLSRSLSLFFSLSQLVNSQGGGSSKTLSVGVVDEALTQPFFAAYCLTMQSVADALLHINHWAEACPCPQDRLPDSALTSHKLCGSHCPLKGLRAPELAAGTLHSLLDRLFHVSMGSILLSPELQVAV